MNILMIAPDTTGLHLETEISLVLRSGLSIYPLMGTVNLKDVLLVEDNYDVLWIAAHGSADGVMLSDGWWHKDDLAAFVRNRFSLIVLNSCQSEEIALDLQEQSGAVIVCTIGEISDRSALQMGFRFAKALVFSDTIQEAFAYAKPRDNTSYRLIEGGFMHEIGKQVTELITALYQLKLEVGLLNNRVEQLETSLERFPNSSFQISSFIMRLLLIFIMIIAVLLGFILYEIATGGS